MSLTRGKFLKELSRSLPGMVLGSGIAAAAQKVLGKVAAASGALETPVALPNAAAKIAQQAEVEFITRGPSGGNRIALTFDDGPTPGVTDLILDELKRHEAHATFFMIGERVAAAPDLARRVLAEGHEVGNHTYTHPNLTHVPDAQVEAEIQKTQDIIALILQHRAAWFRPPFGALRQNQSPMLTSRNLGIALWNVDPGDWAQPGVDKITGKILADTLPGSIIVCHDLFHQTVDGTKIVLADLTRRGLVFSTVSQLVS